MQKLIRTNGTGGARRNHGGFAGFADVRSAAPTVAVAAPNSIDISAAIRRRPFLAILPLLLALGVGVPYAWKHATPEFHSEATIYVSPTYYKNPDGDREQLQVAYTTLVNQQILTIRQYDNLAKVLHDLDRQGIAWRNPAEPEASAVARLNQQLDVRHIVDSYEVLIGMNSPERDWVAPIINTVAKVYLASGENEQQSDRMNRLSALTAEQGSIESRLRNKLDEQSKLSESLMVVNVDKGAPADDALMAATRQARDEAHRRRIEAEAQVAALQANTGTGKTALSSLAEEATANDAGLRATMNSLLQRKTELQSQIEGLTPQHPLRQAAEKELVTINTQLAALPQQSQQDVAGRLLVKLRADVDRFRLLEADLEQEVLSSSSKVQTIAKQVQQAQALGGEIDRLRKFQSEVNTGIDQTTMQDGTPGYLRIVSPAQVPVEPSKTNLTRLLSELLALGILLGIALCILLDIIDQRILNPREVRRAVGFPPLGIVLKGSEENAPASGEHFRRLVNGIQRGIAAEAAKSVVLTPIKPLDSPSTLVTDIGSALAARGLKTVIVDAKPQDGDESGSREFPQLLTMSQLSGTMQNVERTPSRGAEGAPNELSRITTEVPTVSMLKELKRDYDVVLIDAPALRLSADAEFLAGIADITLVVVEVGKTTRRELNQAAALLGRIGAPSMGVILSQVPLRSGKELSRDFDAFTSLSWATAPDTVRFE